MRERAPSAFLSYCFVSSVSVAFNFQTRMNMEDKKRRKSKLESSSSSSSLSKKKKDRPSQRGMGVANLERLRAQENLKQINTLPLHVFMESQQQQPFIINNNLHFPPAFQPIHNHKVGGGRGFNAPLSLDASNVKYQTQNNLSLIPPHSSNVCPFSDKCGFFPKKKRVDDKVANQSHQVEVVAVHQKGGPCGGGVMTEYEFFPEKGGGGHTPPPPPPSVAEELLIVSGGPPSNAYTTTAAATHQNSTSIDLSLKLYY